MLELRQGIGSIDVLTILRWAKGQNLRLVPSSTEGDYPEEIHFHRISKTNYSSFCQPAKICSEFQTSSAQEYAENVFGMIFLLEVEHGRM